MNPTPGVLAFDIFGTSGRLARRHREREVQALHPALDANAFALA